MNNPGDDLSALLAMQRARAELLLAAFDAAPPSTRASSLLAEYRCPRHRCSLLVAWQASGVRLVRLPPYKLSKRRNETETVPSAREKRTTDGDRHWVARVLLLDELGEFGDTVALDLHCDHVSGHIKAADLLGEITGVTPGEPIRRVYPL